MLVVNVWEAEDKKKKVYYNSAGVCGGLSKQKRWLLDWKKETAGSLKENGGGMSSVMREKSIQVFSYVWSG